MGRYIGPSYLNNEDRIGSNLREPRKGYRRVWDFDENRRGRYGRDVSIAKPHGKPVFNSFACRQVAEVAENNNLGELLSAGEFGVSKGCSVRRDARGQSSDDDNQR